MTQNNAQAAPGPRASHYVSLTNGGIYPAMTAPLGHEDANPADWRAANPDEIQRYQQGQLEVDVSPIQLGDAAPAALTALATPAALTLAADDVVVPQAPPASVAPVAEAPVVTGSVNIPSPPAAPTAAPAPVAPPTAPGAIPRAPSAE